jgi:hypothetical protein
VYRDLLAALVRRAAGVDPLVSVVGGHHNTELVVAEHGGDLVVHLVTGYPVVSLDLPGAPQPAAIEDVASLSSIRLRVPATTTSAARVVDGREVPVEVDHGEVVLTDVDDWETIVLRGDWA